MPTLGVHSEVGTLRTVLVCRPGPGPPAAHAGQPRRSAVRRRALGARSAEGPLRLRAEDARARRRGARAARSAGRDARRSAGARVGARPAHHGERRRAGPGARSCARGSTRCRRAKLAEHLIGGIADSRPAEDASSRAMLVGRVRRHRLHHPAGAEHAVSARPVVLDLQRRHRQPDVLAGAQAGDAAAARGLQVPPALQGRGLHDLVGRLRRLLRRGHASRAATSCRSARASSSSAWASARRGRPSSRSPPQLFKHKAATRVIGCLMPKSRAAMHLDTVFTFCDRDLVHGVPRGRRSGPLLQRPAGRQGRRRGPRRQRASVRRGQGRARPEDAARRRNRRQRLGGAARAVGRRQQRRRARRPASSSATTATSTRTRCCARPASR